MNNAVYDNLNSAKDTLEGLKNAVENVTLARNSATAKTALTVLMAKLGDFASNELSGICLAIDEALGELDRLNELVETTEKEGEANNESKDDQSHIN